MNDDELKRLFDNIDGAPDTSARQRAVAVALQAFDAEQAEKTATAGQGTGEPGRHTPDTHSFGRRIMNVLTANSPTQRWLYSGLASAAVLVLGVFIALQLPQHSGISSGKADFAAARSSNPEARPALVADALPPRQSRIEKEATVEASNAAPPASVDLAVDAQGSTVTKTQRPQVAAQPTGALEEVVLTARRRDAAEPVAAHAAAARATSPAQDTVAPPHYQDTGRDRFDTVQANPVKRVAEEPVSTFSIDVDTSSYSFVRRELNRGVLPQKAAVRLEEMVNYFPYDYPLPADRTRPFSTSVSVVDSPWRAGNKLVRIGIQGYELQGERPRANLVFLLDVSGSMDSPDKLPLVKQSMGLLLSRLQPEDTVAIAVYAGAAGSVLEPTPVKEKQKILAALGRLQAGGSTAGGAGIQLAYRLAQSNFVKDGVNRIVLATDGDFNVGISNTDELKGFIERQRESGVYLSVLGFGQGNYNDSLMQALAQNGNGVAAYIDTLGEAQKVLVDEASSTLFPIATDVKIQVEFNPATVSEYRLLGYETRALAEEDFNNDAVDAGDIGAGHRVTALYEITPTGSDSGVFAPSRYRDSGAAAGRSGEYGYLKLRYKLPGEKTSRLIGEPIPVRDESDATALRETRFAAAVAGFAQLLQGGKYTGQWSYGDALQLAQSNRGDDPYGYRAELVQLIRKAEVADAM